MYDMCIESILTKLSLLCDVQICSLYREVENGKKFQTLSNLKIVFFKIKLQKTRNHSSYKFMKIENIFFVGIITSSFQ